MPSFTTKAFANFYKNILAINQSTNAGVDTVLRRVQDGAGQNTSLVLNDDNLLVKPNSDNTTGTFGVQNVSGHTILQVDTTNSIVNIGASMVAANTQYAHFGTSYNDVTGAAGFIADTHYAIQFGSANSFGAIAANVTMGSSTNASFNDTNPADSLTISATAMDIVSCYWYVMDNITIDAVKWLHGADASGGDNTAAHLMAYTVNTGNGSASGDLSAGTVVADGTIITNAGWEQIYYQSMTVQSADVDAGKVILFTFASAAIASDYSINATVKYHIR